MQYLSSSEATTIDRRVRRTLLRRAMWHGLKTFLGLVVVAVLVFGVISGPAQWERVHYWYSEWRAATEASFADATNTKDWISPSRFLRAPIFEAVEVVNAPEMDANTLYIPALDIKAPILWDVPLADSLNGLQEGVVQAQESYKPGEVGRTFIIGHSAGYWWNQNPWTKVFALLDQLKDGDMVYLRTDGEIFAYKMIQSEVVTPSDVHVVRDDALDRNQLALMTCTPVGTTLNRLIVYAERVQVATGPQTQ